jgi:AcrR family transcriptional regulator
MRRLASGRAAIIKTGEGPPRKAGETSMSQARGRTRSKAIAKRQRILDATAKILVATGSTDFPLQDVADEVGIYTASIYYYFKSREDLIQEVVLSSITQFRDQLSASIEALPSESTPIEKIREAIKATVRINASLDDYRRAYNFVLVQPSGLVDGAIRERRQEIRRIWAKLLREAEEAGALAPSIDINLLRYMITGATLWISYWYRPEGRLKADDIADAYADMLLNSCLAGAPPSTAAAPQKKARAVAAKAAPRKPRPRAAKSG